MRVLLLHVLVLFASFELAVIGWGEFYEWGQGPVGQAMLSTTSLGSGGGGGSGSNLSTDPERGGAGFALLLLYELAVTGTEVVLSALKYLTNLVELYKGPSTVSERTLPWWCKYIFLVWLF